MKEPFFNWMFPGLWEPAKKDYAVRTREILLYEYKLVIHSEYCHDEGCEEDCDDAIEAKEDAGTVRDKDQPETPKMPIERMTLQSLLDLLPEGVKPSDVKMRFWDDKYGENATIQYFYKKKLPADPEGFKKAQAYYAECLAAYEAKKAEYDEWKATEELSRKQQEIKELEEKLAQAKKKK